MMKNAMMKMMKIKSKIILKLENKLFCFVVGVGDQDFKSKLANQKVGGKISSNQI